MSKKKLGALLITGVLALGVIGGSFAWFTSKETATNQFATGGGTDTDNPDDPNAGIEIWEVFDKSEAGKATPGVTVNKDVEFRSNVTYAQFVRAKITPKWTSTPSATDGFIAKNTLLKPKYYTHVHQNLEESVGLGHWVYGGDDYYYYMGILPAEGTTNTLLDSVTVNGAANNNYKNAEFDVRIDVETIQVSEDDKAVDTWKKDSNTDIIEKMKEFGEITVTGLGVDAKDVTGQTIAPTLP